MNKKQLHEKKVKGMNAEGNWSRRKKGVQLVTATTGGKAKKSERAPSDRAEQQRKRERRNHGGI